MATVKQFEDLHVWQDARDLVREVYKATKQRGFKRDFSLRDQITRAAVSSMSNIAEGFERGSRKEFIQFLALDQEYIDQSVFEQLRDSALALSRRISKFITYLQSYPKNSRTRRI